MMTPASCLLCLAMALASLPAVRLADAGRPPEPSAASPLGSQPGTDWCRPRAAGQTSRLGTAGPLAAAWTRTDSGSQPTESRARVRGQELHTREEGRRCLSMFERNTTDRLQGLGRLQQRWKSAKRKMHIWYDGQVVPLFRPRNMVGCLIYKSGSSRWKLLFMHAAGQDIAGGIRAPKGNWASGQVFFGSKMDTAEATSYLSDPSSPRFTIVRNPYSRFLSAYLDKMLDSPESQDRYLKWVGLGPKVFGRQLSDAVEDFEDFTSRIYANYKRTGSLCRINPHFAPQVCLCGFQVGFQYDYVLKLEEQARWYPGFVRLAGLEHFVSAGWAVDPGDVENDCFWRIPGMSCQQMGELLRQGCDGPPTHQGVVNQSSRATGGGLKHSTGADGKVAKYYRARSTIEMVTEMFRDDLEGFSYDCM